MRYGIAVFVSIVLLGSACSVDREVASTTVAAEGSSSKIAEQSTAPGPSEPAAASTTTLIAANSGARPGVLGEVATPTEAFCAGLSTILVEFWEPETVSDLFNEPMPYDVCLEKLLADTAGISDDMALWVAFANGCTMAFMETLNSELSLGPEFDIDFALAFCGRPFNELEWGPDDYRITVDGVCYMGYGPNAGIAGCQDTTGVYITTTTVAYTASNNFSEFLDFAATGPEVLGLTRDAAVAAAVAQRWCASGVDYGTGDLAEWVSDLGYIGAGRVQYTDREYAEIANFLPLLADHAMGLLCPEVVDEFRLNVDAFENGVWPFDIRLRSELNGLGRTFFGWEGTAMQEYSDLFRDYRELVPEHWTKVGFAICEELDQGVDPDDRFLSLEAWLDAGAAPTDSLIDAADALHDAAVDSMCPRHSRYYWSIVETGSPWWETPSS